MIPTDFALSLLVAAVVPAGAIYLAARRNRPAPSRRDRPSASGLHLRPVHSRSSVPPSSVP